MKRFFMILMVLIAGRVSETLAQNGEVVRDSLLKFTVRTVTHNGSYSPKHLMAIWITDSANQFVKTLKVRAATEKQHLVKWNAMTGGNQVDAITGATLNAHTTHTVLWDGTNTSGVEVADGLYKIYIEMTENNSYGFGADGPWLSWDFHKNSSPETQTPTAATYFKDLEIVFDPGINTLAFSNSFNSKGNSLNVFPNPAKERFAIDVRLADVGTALISLIDNSGKSVWSGFVEKSQRLWVESDLPAGVYMVRMSGQGFSLAVPVVIGE
ncbi:MAG: DUF2271 domain-containing protein [Bacteroidetes bacterium]|nr:DUF2271 domain-containing protein [Bacteroidota bacterium]MBU1717726.1 DUF2271 domain-containing protein [Bacteroidota bacterium]